MLDLIEMKAAGEEFEVPEVAAEKPKVVDLMAALEASVEAAKSARERHPTPSATKAQGQEVGLKPTAPAEARRSASGRS